MMQHTTSEALAARLFRAEAAIDLALSEAAGLVADLPGARSAACLSAVTGHQIFERATLALAALTQARGHMVATHNGLSALARKIGLESLAVGPLDKPEDTPPVGDEPRAIRLARTASELHSATAQRS